MHRPRLTETEYNQFSLKKLHDKKLYKLLIFSDPHGWLADQSVLRCINKVLQGNKFDEVMIAGDLVDLPFVSRHEKKLYDEGILSGYSEIKEAEYTREQILAPLRHSTDALIRFIPGNHDERIIKPHLCSTSQLARLHVLHKHYQSTEIEDILGFKEYGITWDKKDSYNYFNMFEVVHGLSLAKNAPEKNVIEYMSSGASGHTHRLQNKYITNKKGPYVWFETGCTRVRTEVEYFPTGKIPDWQNGLVTVSFYKEGNDYFFHGECHAVINGATIYNGIIYK